MIVFRRRAYCGWFVGFILTVATASVATVVQRGPLKESELVFLIQSGVATKRIEILVARYGLDFIPTSERLDVIRKSGGDLSLIAALERAGVGDKTALRSPAPTMTPAIQAPRVPGIEPQMILVTDGPGEKYYIARFETTNEQYLSYCEKTGVRPPKAPYWGTPRRLPVVNVSWKEAAMFARWLSEATGRSYHLPSEAEWEYAARGGARIRTYPWGEASPVGRCCFGTGKLCPIGSFGPNALGIHDMVGGVYEWCRDRFTQKSADRVIRGGSWSVPVSSPELVAITRREGLNPDKRRNDVGFRLVRTAP
ncbi:MAG: SUMF1/EgtB/PvdO family nonheme iron enzyme [Vicinamibacteria bacterium]|nr:SUMF1/EgtB/PvdO family nonheme iron enzyme [Vicinamibacteria bacterium]